MSDLSRGNPLGLQILLPYIGHGTLIRMSMFEKARGSPGALRRDELPLQFVVAS
jgi:hypothetical protein